MMFPNLNSNEQVKKMKFKVLAMQDTGRSLKLLLCKHTCIWALSKFFTYNKLGFESKFSLLRESSNVNELQDSSQLLCKI